MKKLIFVLIVAMVLPVMSCTKNEGEFYACGDYVFSITGYVNAADQKVEMTPLTGIMSVYELDGSHDGDLRFILKADSGEVYTATGCVYKGSVDINKFPVNIHLGNDVYHCMIHCQGVIDDKLTIDGTAAVTGTSLSTGASVYSGVTSFVAYRKK